MTKLCLDTFWQPNHNAPHSSIINLAKRFRIFMTRTPVQSFNLASVWRWCATAYAAYGFYFYFSFYFSSAKGAVSSLA
jgi:hypothetical protein